MATAKRIASASRRRSRPRLNSDRAAQKRSTHDRILDSARRIARREGLRAASVPRVMNGAGLTVGGFYAHFASKTAMDAELVQVLQDPLRGLEGLEDAAEQDWLPRAVKRYLSVAHRDNVDGCGYPAVASEVASAPAIVRRAFAEAIEQRVVAFESHTPALSGATSRERALATMALTIGGLLLARATRGHPISEEMISACRRWALPETVR